MTSKRSFLGAEAFIISLMSLLRVVNVAICKCMQQEDEDLEATCVEQLEEVETGSHVFEDWRNVLDTDLVKDFLKACPIESFKDVSKDGLEECDPSKICCTKYVDFLSSWGIEIPTFDNSLKNFFEYDPCDRHWMVQNIYNSLIATFFAAILLVPLVKWMLKFECRCMNPFAYFIILLQVALGISMTWIFTANSIELEVPKYALILATSIAWSLCIDTIWQGMLKEIILWVLCSRRDRTASQPPQGSRWGWAVSSITQTIGLG